MDSKPKTHLEEPTWTDESGPGLSRRQQEEHAALIAEQILRNLKEHEALTAEQLDRDGRIWNRVLGKWVVLDKEQVKT